MGIKERREREKRRREQEIIDAAEEVIFKQGLDNTSVDDIAAHAELGKATLYAYFSSKDEILAHIYLRAMQKLHMLFRGAAEKHTRGSDKVEAIGRAYVAYSQDFPNYYDFISLFQRAELAALNQKYAANQESDVDNVLSESIRVGQEDGSIRSDLDAQVLSKMLWAMTSGTIQLVRNVELRMECAPGTLDEAFYETMFQLLGRGMEAE